MSLLKKVFPNLFPTEENIHNKIRTPRSVPYDPDKVTSITLPKSPEKNLKIKKWFYEPGDQIEIGKPVCEISGKRFTLEFESFIAGKLVWIQEENTVLQVGEEICKIEKTS